eukprot:9821510-Alexandrium_andersonii.AAC.1
MRGHWHGRGMPTRVGGRAWHSCAPPSHGWSLLGSRPPTSRRGSPLELCTERDACLRLWSALRPLKEPGST